MRHINANLSDIFFNHDFYSAGAIDTRADGPEYDRNIMVAEAETLLAQLRALGADVGGVTPAELVEDFFSRL